MVAPEITAILKDRIGDRSAPVDQDHLRAIAAWPNEMTAAYTRAEHYYDGDQGTQLTDRAKQYLERSGLAYTENFCETVVDAMSDRLALAGVNCEDELLSEWLWNVWDRSHMDAGQATLHTETVKLGDGYLLIDWDGTAGRPRFTYNSPTIVRCDYRDGQKVRAVKVWDTDEPSPVNPKGAVVKRMNIYLPGRIEKWFRLSADDPGDWVEWLDEGETVWPSPWVTADGKPLGIPVVHFTNRRGARQYGVSEIRGTIPQQDRLNKELLDLSAVLDTMGYPQRYASGIDIQTMLKTAPGEVWRSANEKTAWGQFESADPAGPLAAIEATLLRIAARSRTPAHMIVLSGGAPSGESLKTAEAGLVAKCKRFGTENGAQYDEAFRLAVRVAATFGTEKPPVDPKALDRIAINPRWTDPETRNEKEHMESLLVMQTLGVSTDTLLSMIPGIDPAAEREKKTLNDQQAGASLVDALLRGGNANPAEPGQGGMP
ncbi:MAG: phage portal protein [bacterium]